MTIKEKLVRLEEENKMLKAQNYIYDLENIQLKQDISLIRDNQEQSTMLFNYIAEVYEELDSLMARLQDDYNNGIEFEQQEEDRLIIGNILDIFTQLEDALPLKKALEKLLEGKENE